MTAVPTPENTTTLLDFVRRYGFLGGDRSGADAEDESISYLQSAQSAAAVLSQSGSLLAKAVNLQGPVLRMCFEAEKAGRTIVRYRPESLYAWLWLRVADDLSSGVRWDGPPCFYCGGAIGRGPGGRRPQAKFCSDKHKVYFNRLSAADRKERISKARELQRRQEERGT